jgi:hypothetical protein
VSFRDEFETIVMGIAKEAMLQATTFEMRIEALKALNTSYGLMMKHKAEAPKETDEFDFSKAIAEEPDNEPQTVRGRRARN